MSKLLDKITGSDSDRIKDIEKQLEKDMKKFDSLNKLYMENYDNNVLKKITKLEKRINSQKMNLDILKKTYIPPIKTVAL